MRTGGYTVQHSLTAEAASIVKQAVSLARRRGHAQVTPLHVASAMLASSTGLLRRSCLQSHSHPLQCKALELCFNVALNRLPTSASNPLLGPHSHHPSLSNALVAAFKRAQAHQRRGSSVENQQQPILALKVELQQLIISILDDPSVSRVMREAGFSSPQVKTNVEQAVSLESSYKSPPATSTQSKESTKPLVFGNNLSHHFQPMNQFRVSFSETSEKVKNEDVMSVLDTMMNKKRKNTVIIAECLGSAEGVVKGVIDKFDRGDVPGDMRLVQFISVPLFSLRNLSREVVEDKLGELRCLVTSQVGRGIVLYLGDLKWVSEFRSNYGEQRNNYYSPMEHMIMELSRLFSGFGGFGKLWLMGIATFHTYIRCKTGHPSLETLWDLNPLTTPLGSLGLSLNFESDLQNQFRSEFSVGSRSLCLNVNGVEKNLSCCADCSANFKREARSIIYNEFTTTSTSSSLPSWLQQYKDENRSRIIADQEYDKVRDLCKKWNSICSAVHKHPHFLENAIHFPSSSPSSSTSVSSHGQRSPKLHQTLLNWPVIFEPGQSPKEHQFFNISVNENEGCVSNMRTQTLVTKPDLLSNPHSSPNSASSSEASGDMECLNRFKELNSENLKILCNALEKKVKWQKDILPEIVTTILQCRSGVIRRKSNNLNYKYEKEETWLFFLGIDSEGKEKIARELAKFVFGSRNNFVSIGLSSFSSSTRADSTEELSSKRARDEHGQSYLERFADAVQENPSRVFFMEDVDQVQYYSQIGIKKAVASGSITLPGGELVPLKDAIVIFSCESCSSMSRACSPPTRQENGENEEEEEAESEHGGEFEERKPCASLDLNIATDDHNGDESSVSDVGILDVVDKQVIFKIQVL